MEPDLETYLTAIFELRLGWSHGPDELACLRALPRDEPPRARGPGHALDLIARVPTQAALGSNGKAP
jgi:hypothetical protein